MDANKDGGQSPPYPMAGLLFLITDYTDFIFRLHRFFDSIFHFFLHHSSFPIRLFLCSQPIATIIVGCACLAFGDDHSLVRSVILFSMVEVSLQNRKRFYLKFLCPQRAAEKNAGDTEKIYMALLPSLLPSVTLKFPEE